MYYLTSQKYFNNLIFFRLYTNLIYKTITIFTRQSYEKIHTFYVFNSRLVFAPNDQVMFLFLFVYAVSKSFSGNFEIFFSFPFIRVHGISRDFDVRKKKTRFRKRCRPLFIDYSRAPQFYFTQLPKLAFTIFVDVFECHGRSSEFLRTFLCL